MIKATKWDGKPISKPGMYLGIDISDYHRHDICDGPSISSSGLRKIFNESPAHFYATWGGNPDAEEDEEKRHFVLGRATHHLLLGQKGFASLFCVEPKDYETEDGLVKPWSNNAKVCKEWNAARRKEGKSILKQSEVDAIKGMAIALGQHPIVRAGALNGLVERSIFWKDKATGVWLKIRPDSIPGDSGDFVDYKSTISVQWGDLVKAISDFGYNQQGALICDGAREVLKVEKPSFSLVFQEKKKPWCPRVVTLKPETLELGRRQNRLALETFARCLKAKHWPGPGGDDEDAAPISLSENAAHYIEKRLERGV